MSGLPWWWWVSAMVMLPLAVWVLWFALLGDRAKGRRRCPKCRYDLAGTPDASREAPVKCPECGRETRSERRLRRGKKRWGLATVAVLVIVAGPVSYRGLTVGWWSMMPTSVLLVGDRVLLDWIENGVWLATPSELSEWHMRLMLEMMQRSPTSVTRWELKRWLTDHPSLRPSLVGLTDLDNETKGLIGFRPEDEYAWLFPKGVVWGGLSYFPLGSFNTPLSDLPDDKPERQVLPAGADRFAIDVVVLKSSSDYSGVEYNSAIHELGSLNALAESGQARQVEWGLLYSSREARPEDDRDLVVEVIWPIGVQLLYDIDPRDVDLGDLIDPRLDFVECVVVVKVRDRRTLESARVEYVRFRITLPVPTAEEIQQAPLFSELIETRVQ